MDRPKSLSHGHFKCADRNFWTRAVNEYSYFSFSSSAARLASSSSSSSRDGMAESILDAFRPARSALVTTLPGPTMPVPLEA